MTDTSKQSIEKIVAFLILALSLLWILLEQIFFGKLFFNALEYSIGFLGIFFVVSAAIGILLGLIRRSHSFVYITFSVVYVFLLLAVKVGLPSVQ
jgi:hypothetical protein